ncbi:MAG: YkgJ family cysteine cluster protein [Deltaproteobacteria bacterium]|nr:MAG: YkgJ family cysteine cluster protein [Deltaproteobacteria bacterium]
MTAVRPNDNMDFIEKKRQVFQLYDEYERLVQPCKTQAVCEKGCASCCIDVGNVGATTLEGLIILEYLQGWDHQAIEEINLSLRENRREKLNSVLVRCPFLDEEASCRIYAVRPFSCRRLYSVKKCDGRGAVVHRQSVVLGQKMEKELQELDPEGCSGHLSFIIHLLEQETFRRGYLEGNWREEDFGDTIKRYELVVHRKEG